MPPPPVRYPLNFPFARRFRWGATRGSSSIILELRQDNASFALFCVISHSDETSANAVFHVCCRWWHKLRTTANFDSRRIADRCCKKLFVQTVRLQALLRSSAALEKRLSKASECSSQRHGGVRLNSSAADGSTSRRSREFGNLNVSAITNCSTPHRSSTSIPVTTLRSLRVQHLFGNASQASGSQNNDKGFTVVVEPLALNELHAYSLVRLTFVQLTEVPHTVYEASCQTILDAIKQNIVNTKT